MNAAALPATPLGVRAIGPAPRMPRFLAAIAVVLACHAAALLLRPGSDGGRAAPTASAVLAVRIVPAVTANAATSSIAEAAPAVQPQPSLPAAPPADSAPTPAPKAPPSPTSPPRHEGAADARREAPAPPRADAAAASAPSLPPAPDYAAAGQLDPGPRPLEEIDPEYPDPVRLRSGTVVLRLLIGDTGRVDEVAVVSAEPTGVFEQAAIDAFAKARFSPGMAGGRPVKSQIRVEVEFMPINRGGRVSGRSY